MPTTIPYDSSLVLGGIVDPARLAALEKISALQAPIDAAQDELNALLAQRQSVTATTMELRDMEIDAAPLEKESAALDKAVTRSAVDYANVRIAQEREIQKVKAGIAKISSGYESPIDFNRTGYKQVPLSTDGMSMDVKYFSHDQNSQDSKSVISALKTFVAVSTSILGNERSAQISAQAATQASAQAQNHEVVGTLVIAITCTKKDATVLAPFYLDVDKAIAAWNDLFPSDTLDPHDTGAMLRLLQFPALSHNVMEVVSGGVYGASFIGMVHVLSDDFTDASNRMTMFQAALQTQAKGSLIVANYAGGFGIDSRTEQDMKDLLSISNIRAHATLIVTGAAATITSETMKYAVKAFSDFSPDKLIESVAKLDAYTVSQQESLQASAAAARAGSEFVAMKNSAVPAVLGKVADLDAQQNKVITTNSLMVAMENFLAKINTCSGVPLHYFLKKFTKNKLAEAWVSKYFPGKYLVATGDDTPRPGQPAPKAGTTNPSQANPPPSEADGGSAPESGSAGEGGGGEGASAGGDGTDPDASGDGSRNHNAEQNG